MSIESLWYSSYVDGQPPHCARLSRRPMAEQWTAPIRMALAGCCWRTVSVFLTGELYYYWPGSDSPTGWWLIPHRVSRRYHAIIEAATWTAVREGGGSAMPEDVQRVIERWARNGQWRRHAARLFPRHGEPPKRPRQRKRRGQKPARMPRGLP